MNLRHNTCFAFYTVSLLYYIFISDVVMLRYCSFFIFNRNSLNWNAVPTLVDVPHPPSTLATKRAPPTKRDPLPAKKRKVDEGPTISPTGLYKI